MQVVLAEPRGFCAGVVRAIEAQVQDVIAALRRLGPVEVPTLPGIPENVQFRAAERTRRRR